MLEMVDSELTSVQTDQLVEEMFVTAKLDKSGGVLTLSDFLKVMAGENIMWDVNLQWKGMFVYQLISLVLLYPF